MEETLAEGASVARIAQAYGLNANLVFNWRKLVSNGSAVRPRRSQAVAGQGESGESGDINSTQSWFLPVEKADLGFVQGMAITLQMQLMESVSI